jgi:hypothetical protein
VKAYQVFSGDYDKHGRQYYDLNSTFFSKEKALQRCKEIVEGDKFKNETIIESEWYNLGRAKDWDIQGWEWITVCRLQEIEITE